jgi:uncharacterized protein with PQ loop repeat
VVHPAAVEEAAAEAAGRLMPKQEWVDMHILDVLTILSYLALNIDIILQIKRIYKTKSSEDLSLSGMTIRYVAILVILIKFVSLSDMPLMIGQGIIAVTFTIYFVLAMLYFWHRHKA